MQIPPQSDAYRLLDSGHFQKLEQVGAYRVVRPAAQAVWQPRLPQAEWQTADAAFSRFSGGDGKWEVRNRHLPESWSIVVPEFGRLVVRLTDFGHLGLFAEQQRNWGQMRALVEARRARGQATEVLNLFAYTGGSTLACAAGGANVVHLDASKTSVQWGRDNAAASGLEQAPVRWIVDDVQKFVARELRRGSLYHGLILDPPSYGRGPKGETWKIEDMMLPLLADLRRLLAPDFAFILLSSHSAGYTPLALTNLVDDMLVAHGHERTATAGMTLNAEEMVVWDTHGRALPSGASCLVARSTP